jgi:hypothetical protein
LQPTGPLGSDATGSPKGVRLVIVPAANISVDVGGNPMMAMSAIDRAASAGQDLAEALTPPPAPRASSWSCRDKYQAVCAGRPHAVSAPDITANVSRSYLCCSGRARRRNGFQPLLPSAFSGALRFVMEAAEPKWAQSAHWNAAENQSRSCEERIRRTPLRTSRGSADSPAESRAIRAKQFVCASQIQYHFIV